MINGISETISSSGTSSAASSNPSGVSSAAEMQDQFLALLVAQLQNQDPMNPMDNAQMTSQMAQISTVTGLEKLNDTVTSVTSQFNSMQILQGSSMIGRTILSEGDQLGVVPVESVDEEGNTSQSVMGTGAFNLADSSPEVTIKILSSSGQVVDTIDYGTADEGRNYFNWTPPADYEGDTSNLRFKVEARNGDMVAAAQTLSPSSVISSRVDNGRLYLELANGDMKTLDSIEAVY